MTKKLFSLIAVALLLAGCANKTEEDYIGLINEAREAIAATHSQEELNKVSSEYFRKMSDFADKHAEELKMVENEKESTGKILTAQQAFSETYTKKLMELSQK